MKTVQAVQAVRTHVKVSRDQRVEIKGLPFQPGSEVEVIVVGSGKEQERATGQDIYAYTED